MQRKCIVTLFPFIIGHTAKLSDVTVRQTVRQRTGNATFTGSLRSALWIIDTDTCRDPGSQHRPMTTANTHIRRYAEPARYRMSHVELRSVQRSLDIREERREAPAWADFREKRQDWGENGIDVSVLEKAVRVFLRLWNLMYQKAFLIRRLFCCWFPQLMLQTFNNKCSTCFSHYCHIIAQVCKAA